MDLTDSIRVNKTARNLIAATTKGKLESYVIISTTSSVSMTVDPSADDAAGINNTEGWITPKKKIEKNQLL